MTEQKRRELDANILLRAVLGVRVRTILETFEDSANFYAPDICFGDARKYFDVISVARKLDPSNGLVVLSQIARLVESVDQSVYEEFKTTVQERMRHRDMADWPIAATSLLLDCPIWTEDPDFFGSGIATWVTGSFELYLRDG
jgi:predicted nucleic acid-binding protein